MYPVFGMQEFSLYSPFAAGVGVVGSSEASVESLDSPDGSVEGSSEGCSTEWASSEDVSLDGSSEGFSLEGFSSECAASPEWWASSE
jgi:hypothetical protein